MEDRDQIKPDEDVEAHRRGPKIKATDDTTESGDDVELHKKRSAQDEGGEASGDDDVELHRKGKLLK